VRTIKNFLEQEKSNLAAVLDETLRFKYGSDGSKDFFEECRARIEFVSAELNKTSDTDNVNLQKIAGLLLELSGLLSRIERSSVSEYSWPFVEELKRIAVAICTEATLTNSSSPPKIHVLSDGGLDKYQIFTEANRPSSAGRRILTIVVPRTLKHFVLLHSILGHEIGHAMWQCSKHQKELRDIVNRHLFGSAGIFANPAATASWIYSSTAPPLVRSALSNLAPHGINQNTFFKWASWQAWAEEILCDFIGVLTFGPTFVAAESNLLYSIDPSGTSLGQKHPPVACRINYLLTAAKLRGIDFEAFSDPSVSSTVKSFWTIQKAKYQADTWFSVFTDAQIKSVADEIAALLGTLPPALYSVPTESDLKHLLEQLVATIPPTGFQIESSGDMNFWAIDFRHVLYSGWIASVTVPGISFEQINRLCEHGIMQQRAIDIAKT
jgi:hypothetical protein